MAYKKGKLVQSQNILDFWSIDMQDHAIGVLLQNKMEKRDKRVFDLKSEKINTNWTYKFDFVAFVNSEQQQIAALWLVLNCYKDK